MLLVGLLALTLVQEPRPDRPDDEALRASVTTQRPDTRLLTLDFTDSRRGGARIGCGTMEVAGVIEPVSVVAAWKPRSQIIVAVIGVPPRPPEEARWDIQVAGPTRSDRDNDGEIGWYDRSADAQARKMVQLFCPDLAAPSGVTWITESEPHPDPERAARTRQRARTATDLIFGPSQSEVVPPNP